MAENNDIHKWKSLAYEVAQLFNSPNMPWDDEFIDYMKAKIRKHEAIIAMDRMTRTMFGVIGFSRNSNHISWFAVKKNLRGNGIGTKLLKCAINQLDWQRDISVITFCKDNDEGLPARKLYKKFGFIEVDGCIKDDNGNTRCKMIKKSTVTKKGKSFHYAYDRYYKYSQKEFCKPCNAEPMPSNQLDIAELEHSYICGERTAQGRLFGKCYVMPKVHVVNFEDMKADDMNGFMKEVQVAGKALKNVTDAVKINYEMHANTGPHLHIHLFPRYLDDDFPSAPIDYRATVPSPYENEEEFQWFIERMRTEISKLT